MYKRVTVAHNESPEASRALTSNSPGQDAGPTELRAVTILESPPSYTAFAGAADPSLTLIINSDRMQAYERFAVRGPPGRQAALCEGVEFKIHLVEGEEVYAIVRFLADYKADLLVIGLHHHQSRISHLWSTVYALAEDAPCSVRGAH